MFLSEVDAILSLVGKATTGITLLHDGWYKNSADLGAYREKVLVLSERHAQWSEQQRRYGISDDKHLLRVVKLAEDALEKAQQEVLKLQKSPLRRWKKRVFPTDLSYFLDKVLEIVDAGPLLLATRVANNNLLEQYLQQAAAPLPFGRDPNYVPIEESISEVQNALEKQGGSPVVKVYGGPGMGKSSLAKYLAIHYQDEKKRRRVGVSFPDGVYYLFCGQEAGSRVKQLHLELLETLGFGNRSRRRNNSATIRGVQDGDYIPLPSHQMKLRTRLAKQECLIVLDDLWDAKVLDEIRVPAERVKYLITSQMRDVYYPAEMIQIRRPTLGEARQIMANYTKGLPKKGEFPHHIQRAADKIIEELDHHPLALANIGISINCSRATDASQWEVIKNHLYTHLDENDSRSTPGYSLATSASMMLMVESLPAEVQRLLFLIALFRDQYLPEPLVKFFYSFIETDQFSVKYNNHQTLLEDRSLIESTVQENRITLGAHTLRTRYVRQMKDIELRSICSQILVVNGDQNAGKPIKTVDSENTLAIVLSAAYFDQAFQDIVVGPFDNHMKYLNGGVIPRSLTTDSGTLDLSAWGFRDRIKGLTWLLNVDREDENWKLDAHECAKKIILKFACKGELEDNGMARLIRLPNTFTIACGALNLMCEPCHSTKFYDQNIGFSKVYMETMQALLDVTLNKTLSVETRAEAIGSLFRVFDYESKDTILIFATTYLEAIKHDSNLQSAATQALEKSEWSRVGILEVVQCEGILESILVTLESGDNHTQRLLVGNFVRRLCYYKNLAPRIAHFPDTLKTLFSWFVSTDMNLLGGLLQKYGGDALCILARHPDLRVTIGAVGGITAGLRDILTHIKETWRTSDTRQREKLARWGAKTAQILGYLALETNLKGTMASLVGLRESLLWLQLVHFPVKLDVDGPEYPLLSYSTRAFTILYSALGHPGLMDVPEIQDVLEVFRDKKGVSPRALTSWEVHISYLSIYWSRVVAYLEMVSFGEALTNLDLAQHHLDLSKSQTIPQDSYFYTLNNCTIIGGIGAVEKELGRCRVFLQTMVGDYVSALLNANAMVKQSVQFGHPWERIAPWTERGISKMLSGDLQGALDDLNAAVKTRNHYIDILWNRGYTIWHRGYVKYLMNDITGAKDDAKLAKQGKLGKLTIRTNYRLTLTREETLWQLRRIPVTYLGLSLVDST